MRPPRRSDLRLPALLFAAAALTGALSPALAADPNYEAGVAALQAKNIGQAIAAFSRCVKAAPAGSADAVNCHWELGWAYWARADWKHTVEHWEAVQKAQPSREGLSEFLPQARDNKALAQLLDKAAHATPYVSQAPKGASVRIRAVGDLMIGTTFPEGALQADDAVGTFNDVSDWLRDADLTFGNMEGPLCDIGETNKCKPDAPPSSCYAFRSPSRYAKIYQAAGFDLVSTANNHASDFGYECRLATEQALDAVGIRHSGRPGDIATTTVNGVKVAMIGFHTNRNSHFVNDHEQAGAIVRAVAAENDLVIVSFHGGAEGGKATHVPQTNEIFYGEDRGDLRAFTHAVIDAGADLVLGHGPHVLRGMEMYKDRLIVYSMGNFATYGRFSLKGASGVGAVVEATLAADGRFKGGRVLPTQQLGGGVPAKDPEKRAILSIRDLSVQDFPGTAVTITEDGAILPPGGGG
jgi:poly-gamma-glutamate capsule biosynthesis protein CapA/YwtB (metallophosphatase superfamily)